MRQMEVDIAAMKQQHYKFEGWLHDAARADQETTQRLNEVAQQVSGQQAQLDVLSQRSEATQRSLDTMTTDFRSDMSKGFKQIQALLAKRL